MVLKIGEGKTRVEVHTVIYFEGQYGVINILVVALDSFAEFWEGVKFNNKLLACCRSRGSGDGGGREEM